MEGLRTQVGRGNDHASLLFGYVIVVYPFGNYLDLQREGGVGRLRLPICHQLVND